MICTTFLRPFSKIAPYFGKEMSIFEIFQYYSWSEHSPFLLKKGYFQGVHSKTPEIHVFGMRNTSIYFRLFFRRILYNGNSVLTAMDSKNLEPGENFRTSLILGRCFPIRQSFFDLRASFLQSCQYGVFSVKSYIFEYISIF